MGPPLSAPRCPTCDAPLDGDGEPGPGGASCVDCGPDTFFARRRPDYYAAQYCEENVWHLCRDERARADEAHVVFVSNAARSCALWRQRAAARERAPVLWDYHVILLGRRDGWHVWDLDTTLPCPAPALDYLRETFPRQRAVPPPLRPRFRLVPRQAFLDAFASDRSHMRGADGAWLAPPPAGPAICTAGETMNLMRFADTERPFLGRVFDLAGLRAWLAAGGG